MQRVVTQILSKGRKTLEDFNLLKVLQSEISFELTNDPFEDVKVGSLGDFVLEWDSLDSRDVVLRRKSESGEEIAVSAMLGEETIRVMPIFSREVLMKVCVKKPGLSPMLHFDCGVTEVSEKSAPRCDFNIHSAFYLQSKTIPSSSVYRGPLFSTLDPQLQDELKKYLISRGIGENLTYFLLLALHKKEQGQYLNWLQKLESFVAKEE